MSWTTLSSGLLIVLAAVGVVPARGDAGERAAPGAVRAQQPDDPYVADLLTAARAQGLARDRAWLRLGHWRPRLLGGFESEADGAGFFLVPEGKRDPAAELEAMLRGLFAPVRPSPGDVKSDHPQCRFPARAAFLVRRLGIDPARLPAQPCPRFEEFWRRVQARSVALVFSSYYLNNPASAFGHTFLRLGKTDLATPGERFELVDQGVDYAATPDTSNAILYAFKGLTGLFRGEFTARPYFYKVREYADYESRDLWEYELALEPDELAMLVGHLWELGQTWFDYYYVTENCSYHILGALEAAAPRLELLSRVGKVTLPADTVKALFTNPGLVRAVRFRPSGRTQLEARAYGLSGTQLDRVTTLAEGGEPEAFASLPQAERVRLLDTALDLFDVRHGRAIIEGSDPAADALRQRLLERRSAILVASEPLAIAPPRSGGPERGHGSMRLGVGGGASSSDGAMVVFDGRLALHDLVDPPPGFSPHTQLEFLKFRADVLPRSKSLRLDYATLFEATSLNGFGRLERRVSWKARAGAVRVTDAGCPGCVAGDFEVGGGPALLSRGGAVAVAVTADAECLGTPGLHGLAGGPLRPGVGPGGLVRLLAGDRVALLGTATWRYLPFASPRTSFQLGAVARLHLGAVSLSAEWRRTPIAYEGTLSVQLFAR
jgi:Domain of unknown function (DUF4105)